MPAPTDWDRARARELYDQGKSHRAIARELKISPSTVIGYAYRHDWPKRERDSMQLYFLPRSDAVLPPRPVPRGVSTLPPLPSLRDSDVS